MRNTKIDEAILDDLQRAGYPEIVITDEVLADIEKARGKHNVVV